MQIPRFSPQSSALSSSARAAFGLIAFVTLGFLIVGGARDDLVSLLIWRPLTMIALALAVSSRWNLAWRNGRAIMWFAIAAIGLPVLQLIPLPPGLWSALPGRDLLVDIYRDAEMALPWQPLSVAQARTWNSLFSLGAPLTVFVIALSLDGPEQRRLLITLLALGFASGVIGMLQVIGPNQGPLYFYRITNDGLSVGLFANRNHQAVFLATMYPLLAAQLSLFKGKPEQLFFARATVFAAGCLLTPLILITGSRAGVIIGLAGILSTWWVYHPPAAKTRSAERKTETRKRIIGLGLVALLVLFAMIVALRTSAVQRLFDTDPAGELRISALPVIWQATTRFFPFGSGLGTFVETYKIFEPDRLIAASYFNHAHNDFLEMLLTAGIPGVLLLLWATVLFVLAARSQFMLRGLVADNAAFQARILGRAGLAIIAMLALSSATDYPLRTPSLMMFVAIAAVWCSNAYRASQK